jgi:hypothetical protein
MAPLPASIPSALRGIKSTSSMAFGRIESALRDLSSSDQLTNSQRKLVLQLVELSMFAANDIDVACEVAKEFCHE